VAAGLTQVRVAQSLGRRLAFTDSQPSLVVQALCRDLWAGRVNLNIHVDDEMFAFFRFVQGYEPERAAAMYFDSGRHIWSTLRQIVAWHFGEVAQCGPLLDFASGYGRVTRHLVAEVPAEDVWVSDISAEGVAFQERQFGVHGVVSSYDPGNLRCEMAFACIIVSSLFTHLPATRFTGWLRRLGELLAPRGLLMFSVHDAALAPEGTAFSQEGIAFVTQSESAQLAAAEYGTTWVREAFVRRAVEDALGRCAVWRMPRGLASFQDLYVVVPGERPLQDAAAVFTTLRLRRRADGFMEGCSWAGRRTLSLRGWAGDRLSEEPPIEVRALIDGAVAARSTDLRPRPPHPPVFAADPMIAVGWELQVELPPSADADTARLAIRPVSSAGEELELFEDSIVGALLRSAIAECLVAKEPGGGG
jgi:SAM-dependent methyltransferase